MSLIEEWRDKAYGDGTEPKERKKLWKDYFAKEKEIYKDILSNYTQTISCTVAELAEKYDTDIQTIIGFLDGINDSLKQANPLDKLKEKSKIKIEIDPEKLYYNMCEAKADWLYHLEEWDAILTEERRKEIYKEQKTSGTVIKQKKIGRNDPCPCGSGKKYKYCCGK